MARSRRPQDAFGKRARREGYPARSVYKLEEIDRKVRLFRPGQRVLDLGAAPGSWSRYAAEKVGPRGRVVGYDLQPVRGALPPNAAIHARDVFQIAPEDLGTFDVVISDMAPSTTGQKSLDQYRSFELFMRALTVADGVLLPGGHFVGKLFQSGHFQEARQEVTRRFETVRTVRPKATRTESYEVFLVGLAARPPDQR